MLPCSVVGHVSMSEISSKIDAFGLTDSSSWEKGKIGMIQMIISERLTYCSDKWVWMNQQ